MNSTSKLDASGLLYEGSDFKKWLLALRPVLAQHFPGLSCSGAPWWFFSLPPGVSHSDVCDSIWWHVSPHVRSRVPENDRKTPEQLVSALCATARPFRFMDLPAEIRLRVYKIELAAKTSPQTLRLWKRGPESWPMTWEYNYDPLLEPQLLSINRQMRMEALPEYYRATSVNLTFSNRICKTVVLVSFKDRLRHKHGHSQGFRPTNVERVDAMHKWASTIMPDSMRNLRRISVQLSLLAICTKRGCEDMLHFSLSVVNGEPKLHVTPHAWLKPGSQTLLNDHASATSNVARTLKLEGEALIMVLVSRPDIWDQLELADE